MTKNEMVLNLIGERWTRVKLLAHQFHIAPEIVERRRKKRGRSYTGIVADCISGTTHRLYKKGLLERRLINPDIPKLGYEYRRNISGKSYIQRVRECIERGEDPYELEGIPRDTIRYYKCIVLRERKRQSLAETESA